MSDPRHISRGRPPSPLAVILGTNEIASAVAVHLIRVGHSVVLSHDPLPPVIRRKMAFHDALFDDAVSVAGVAAMRAETSLEARAGMRQTSDVIVTKLGLLDLIVIQTIDVLIDARMHKYQVKPDLRRLGRLTVGLGPGFSGGYNCDLAIETRPGRVGRIIQDGPTDPPDGISYRLGKLRTERFVYAEVPGRWHTAVEIGTRVFKNFVVGHLGSAPIYAPYDGILRGVVRDGIEVPSGVKLFEIDTRGRKASWTGIDGRAQVIAKAVAKAISLREGKLQATRVLYLVE